MPRFSNHRESPTRIENLRKSTSKSPSPEWRHEQAPILLSESTSNNTEQPRDTLPRVYKAPNPAKRKYSPEPSDISSMAKRQKLDERGTTKRRRSIPLITPASGLPQTKDSAQTRSISTTPEVAPQEKKCALVWRVWHSPGGRGKGPKREDSVRSLTPSVAMLTSHEVDGGEMERAQLGPAGSSTLLSPRPLLRRVRRQIFKVGGETLSLATKGHNTDSRGKPQPGQDAREHSATARKGGTMDTSMLEPNQGGKDWSSHKSQMHSHAASDSARNTVSTTGMGAPSTVEDDAGDLLACKLSRMAPFASPSMLPTDAEFSIADVEKAVDVLTTISNLCDTISGQPKAETRAKLYDKLGELPFLLTRQGRDKQPQMAKSFWKFVYRHPNSARWGPIESFDKLRDDIMGLSLFRVRSKASPKERHQGVFEV
ncbi:hypothetical protein CEP54_003144 [Fusarium duplospermum]|uniref:Uncharacterized protein n=1 Tax=Fusarium duplospermum TaxID=1325734 RepID=A0A428QR07_9HYPO|nr:hypothetical protein CEP54_003144 [Fusarium duplospermum]